MMNVLDVVVDELRQNHVQIHKETLAVHLNTILDQHEYLLQGQVYDYEHLYREIRVTNFGRLCAYLAYVCSNCDSEKSIRQHVRHCVPAFCRISLPKQKPRRKWPIVLAFASTLLALYAIL